MTDRSCSRKDPDRQEMLRRLPRYPGISSLWPSLLLLLFFSGFAKADWTGVAFEIGDTKSDWDFSQGTRETKITSISLQIEERTASGLSVGAGIGYLSIRVGGKDNVESQKFDGENLEIYLRQDLSVSESFSLQALLNYGFYNGRENVSSDRDEIDWNQLGFEVGASFRHANLRITPFASYTDIDGDISGDEPTRVFSLEDPAGYGLRFDYFVETTAFLRLQFQSGSHTGGYLTFVRRY